MILYSAQDFALLRTSDVRVDGSHFFGALPFFLSDTIAIPVLNEFALILEFLADIASLMGSIFDRGNTTATET